MRKCNHSACSLELSDFSLTHSAHRLKQGVRGKSRTEIIPANLLFLAADN